MGACMSNQLEGLVQGNTEPLLDGEEAGAVNNLLRYLENDHLGSAALTPQQLEALRTLSYASDVELQRSAALCFLEISEKLSDPVSDSMLQPLKHLLSSSDDEVLKAASLALSNFALYGSAINKSTIIRNGLLEPLINLLTMSSLDVQCNACGCITTLATTESNKVEIVRQGAALPLIQLARQSNPRAQRNASGSLLNLTHIASNRQQLVTAGAIPVLIKLLQSQDEDVQYYSAAAISNLAVDVEHRKSLTACEGGVVIKRLMTLLEYPSDKVRCQACLAFRNLASEEENQVRMVRAGSLAVLLSLLRSASYDTIGAAIAALRNLSIHDSNAKPIIDCGFLPELSQLLVLQQYPEIQFHAAGTIRNLATEELSQPIAESGCIACLAEVLRDYSQMTDMVLSETSAALAVLASSTAVQKVLLQVLDGNFYKVVLLLIQSPYSEVQYNCSAILGNLILHSELHPKLLGASPSLPELLEELLRSSEESLQQAALWILVQFSVAGFKDFGAAEFENLNGLIQSMDSQRDGGELVESVRRILHAPT